MQHIIQALSELDFDVESKNKESVYLNKQGLKVPRVTEVLSRMLHSDSLMYWANSLGFKGLKYRDVLNKAANAGTAAHTAIERFLKEKIKDKSNIPFLGFLSWYDTITIDLGLSIEVIYVEHKMSCDWFGGTLDALIKIDGKIYLVDFKTSNHVTVNYFFQLAAYRYMLRVIEGIEVDGVIVLQLDKTEPGFNEYLLTFSDASHLDFMNRCEISFMSILYAYYNVCKAESDFKYIF